VALTTSAIHCEERAYYLQREHDRRVEEYVQLEERLPHSIEIEAMRFAVNVMRERGHGYVADILAAYVDRWKKAQA
jgi:hypothetical protein